MPIARDGLRELLISTLILGAGSILLGWAALSISAWFWMLAVPLFAMWLFTIAFFRDPNRSIPCEPGLLVAPADGKVTEVSTLDHVEEIGGPAIKISIFLSVFDVHVNRTACGGKVVRTDYRPGEFLDARHPECGIRNECNTIVIDPDEGIQGPVVIRQIAGLIARRIVCNVRAGDAIQRGQRIGLIKFGSRTDLLVPTKSGLESAVRVNDYVKGGSTILMRMAKTEKIGDASENQQFAETATRN